MLTHCFAFLEGISPAKEKKLHDTGIRTWDDFLKSERIKGISATKKAYYDRQLLLAQDALVHKNPNYFAELLPQREMWRLYPHFRDVCFLDIEADSRGIIVLTLFDKYESKTFVRGVHLEKDTVHQELGKYQLIVTFNGSSYDLPKLKKFGVEIHVPHIDLKALCQRLKLIGGLKEVEIQLGIHRPQHLRGSATDAWRAFWASGDREYLELLVAYNEQDAVSLYQLMEKCMKMVAEK